MEKMEKAIDDLLNYLCVSWGFCIDEESIVRIRTSNYLKADDFACAVLEAEGMNSELEIEFRRKIRNKFIERFGSELTEEHFNNAL